MKQKLVEFYLTHGARAGMRNPDWEFAPNELRDSHIRWPRVYQWSAASDWVEVLKYGFKKNITIVEVDDIPQPYKGTVIFQFVVGSSVKNVALGYSDYLAIDDDCAKLCDLYFKMQYDINGYPYEHVVPGGFVPDGKRLYFHLQKLRNLRNCKEYQFDVNGRFSLNYAPEIRQAAIGLLSEQNAFTFGGGLKTVSYSEFLKEIAKSKICIDLPGLGPFCFRLINYMAIGSCVIAYPHAASLHIPLIDRKHIVFCKEDFSDLVELCEYYLKNDAEREQIANNARNFFNLNLHKDNLAKYYLSTCISRLK